MVISHMLEKCEQNYSSMHDNYGMCACRYFYLLILTFARFRYIITE